MWSQVQISTFQVWDDLQWRATAIWQDDPDQEPIVLAKSGTCPIGDADSPEAVLRAVVSALATSTRSDWALR